MSKPRILDAEKNKIISISLNGEATVIDENRNVNIEASQGKTAYENAVDGGYSGSEEEFNVEFASVLKNSVAKVQPSVENNIALLSKEGNLVDSGISFIINEDNSLTLRINN